MLKGKKQIVRRTTFLYPPADAVGTPPPYAGSVHFRVNRETVRRALYNQLQTKSLGSNRINFRVKTSMRVGCRKNNSDNTA